MERIQRKKANQTTYPQEGSVVYGSPAQLHQSPVPIYEHLENEHSLMSEWPHYSPLEAYSTFCQEDGLLFDLPFREPTPELLNIADPNIAPFQFSSSSLSEALSDPPRPAPALPPLSAVNTPELIPTVQLNDCERQSSLSPLSQCDGIPDVNDILMSFDNLSNQAMDQEDMDISIPSISYECDHLDNKGFSPADYSSYFSASPISISSEITRVSDPSQNLWKPRNMSEIDLENSPFSVFGLLQDGHNSSSTSSTPYILSSPISLTSSPYTPSVVDLPVGEQPSSNSLLFSPPYDPHASTAPRPKKAISIRKRSKTSLKAASASRLSSKLSIWKEFDILSFIIRKILTIFL